MEVLLQENRTFDPPGPFVAQANARDGALYDEARGDFEGFWARQASALQWIKPWERVLDWNVPFARWFVGGKLNVSVNCIDRHLAGPRKNKAAIVWESDDPEVSRVLTYQDLSREVNRFANALRALGAKKGDRINIYMGMVPELAIALLACARIGAPHSVVFGGFASDSLRDRIQDARAKFLITCDGARRGGKTVPLKTMADEAVDQCPTIEKVVVLRRTGESVPMKTGRDVWWHDVVRDQPLVCAPEAMDSEDLLFLLYTSGTTGRPKGIMHTTGGYLTGVAYTSRYVFDLKDEDTFWCTADIGWVTGHSYLVYGPLANGATSVMFEGVPGHPDKDRFWRVIEKYRVNIFYTAPTAIRTCMKWGEEFPRRCDLSSLRLLGTVGEPINPEAWIWYHKNVGRERCPIVDTWWQTETGSILISPLPGVTRTKPGSATFPLPGVEADIVDESGTSVPKGGGGLLVLKKPWPSMLRGIYGDEQRYRDTYWGRFGTMYFAGDGAKRDADGYFWLLGRVDDEMKISGHRISTMEVESALVDHPAVAEAAVIGRQDAITGQAICAFVILKAGNGPSDELKERLREHVAKKIGKIARPADLIFASEVPKTRSGKIMRRLLRDVAEGRALGDTTTLLDGAVVESLKKQYEGKEE
jgi:acetyl-CoA synthetase